MKTNKVYGGTITHININFLAKHPDNEKLLPALSEDERELLKKRMEKELEPQPFVVLRTKEGENKFVVLDGNNRLSILQEMGFDYSIPCIIKKDMSLEQQRTYIERCSLGRRNLTKEAKVEIAQRQVARGISQAEVAKLLGINQATVSRATADVKEVRKEIETQAVQMLREAGLSTREIEKETGVSHGTVVKNMQMHKNDQQTNIDKPTPEIAKTQVKILLSEDLILEKAKEKSLALPKISYPDSEPLFPMPEKPANAIMNYTNENIEWAKWSWNPVTGCLHDCQYCYARDIANRFFGNFEPKFWENRLTMPANTKIPASKINESGIKNVFVCSMADLWGDWVPKEWIEKVLAVCKEQKQWTYLFLTKNPKRYLEFENEIPQNCWVGATADTQKRLDNAVEAFQAFKKRPQVLFLSCEPLLENLTMPDVKFIDWLIIGGQSKSSRCPEFQPDWRWVSKLVSWSDKHNVSLYFKPNLTVRPKEYPVCQS